MVGLSRILGLGVAEVGACDTFTHEMSKLVKSS